MTTRPGLDRDTLIKLIDKHCDIGDYGTGASDPEGLADAILALASPATGDSRPECAECQRQERLLGADPTEEWVADEWSRTTEHPHTGDSRPDLRLPEPQPGDFVVGDDGAMFKSEGLEG